VRVVLWFCGSQPRKISRRANPSQFVGRRGDRLPRGWLAWARVCQCSRRSTFIVKYERQVRYAGGTQAGAMVASTIRKGGQERPDRRKPAHCSIRRVTRLAEISRIQCTPLPSGFRAAAPRRKGCSAAGAGPKRRAGRGRRSSRGSLEAKEHSPAPVRWPRSSPRRPGA